MTHGSEFWHTIEEYSIRALFAMLSACVWAFWRLFGRVRELETAHSDLSTKVEDTQSGNSNVIEKLNDSGTRLILLEKNAENVNKKIDRLFQLHEEDTRRTTNIGHAVSRIEGALGCGPKKEEK